MTVVSPCCFFFKQNTAYELRISDWSSDVCSSDLAWIGTMSALENVRRALVIAPHPDDEILGCGGTIARLCAAGVEVHVAIVTRGKPPRFDAAHVRRVEEEARAAHDFLGVTRRDRKSVV